MCVLCKGARMLCGKERCPLLVKFYSMAKTKPLLDSLKIEGSSPPGVFVGRIGWPNVFVGPLIPPIKGDTSMLDQPELWLDKSIEEIADFRFQLVRGKYVTNVKNVESSNKIIQLTRELALAEASTSVEAEFSKKPVNKIVLNDEVQPFGPSAPLKKINIENIKTEQKIEKVYSDTDMKAKDAILYLYEKNILISQIQKAFSVGAFGIEKRRCFVPTRWSITAVDSNISKVFVDEIKNYACINEFRVFESWKLDNRFVVLMLPGHWSYELIEAWYPNTIWNPGNKTVIFSDSEGFEGRTEYPDIGGCYFAARLAVSDYLRKERRQACIVILRESHPGYIMPVGVWNVRENVRAALKGEMRKFATLNEALGYISTRLKIRLPDWIANSKLLRDFLFQKRLSDFK